MHLETLVKFKDHIYIYSQCGSKLKHALVEGTATNHVDSCHYCKQARVTSSLCATLLSQDTDDGHGLHRQSQLCQPIRPQVRPARGIGLLRFRRPWPRRDRSQRLAPELSVGMLRPRMYWGRRQSVIFRRNNYNTVPSTNSNQAVVIEAARTRRTRIAGRFRPCLLSRLGYNLSRRCLLPISSQSALQGPFPV